MKYKFLFYFLLLFSLRVSAQSWMWGSQEMGSGDVWNVATNSNGDAYQTGNFRSTILFGLNQLNNSTAGAGADVFLVKYNSSGNALWAKQSFIINGSLSSSVGNSVATDISGNICVVGNFYGDIYFGSDTLIDSLWPPPKYGSVFLVKYNSNGTVLWARQSDVRDINSNGGTGWSVATDISSNIYITGSFQNTISFGTDTLSNNFKPASYGDVYLIKYNPNGNVLWAKQSTIPSSSSFGTAYSVTTDIWDNVYVTGFFDDTISFGAYTLHGKLHTDNIFLVKYDSLGKVLWARQSTGSVNDAYSVTTDFSGNIYTTGQFENSVSFDTITLSSNNSQYGDIFLVKYDSSGKVLWAKQSFSHPVKLNFSDISKAGYSLASDKYGHIFLSGAIDTTTFFCGDTLNVPLGKADPAMIMEFDTAGNALCSSVICTGGDDNNAVTCDLTGKYVYLGGDAYYSVVLGSDSLSPYTYGEAAFVARWQPCEGGSEQGVINISKQNLNAIIFPRPEQRNFYYSNHW